MSAADSPQPVAPIFHNILRWYAENARDLAWRVGPAARRRGVAADPYRVWVSEIMLQQTLAATVQQRFPRFMARFPTLADLAAATPDALAAEWAGLGYYARMRNLHAAARLVVERHGGILPGAVETLESLPGIGRYTARAIAAIAFDAPVTPVDGNVMRIYARLVGFEARRPAARSDLMRRAEGLAPGPHPGDFAQGLMDLGATICTPRRPLCRACPLAGRCRAFELCTPEAFPGRLAKPDKPVKFGACFLLIEAATGHVWLERRPARGLLGGLWVPPMSALLAAPESDWLGLAPEEWADYAWRAAGTVEHSFTHFDLKLALLTAVAEGPAPAAPTSAPADTLPDRGFFPRQGPARPGLPRLADKALSAIA